MLRRISACRGRNSSPASPGSSRTGPGRPGLRRAGGGVKRGPAPGPARETRNRARECAGDPNRIVARIRPSKMSIDTRVSRRTATSPGDQGIVVRPDRAVVIGHRVVAGLALATVRTPQPEQKTSLHQRLQRSHRGRRAQCRMPGRARDCWCAPRSAAFRRPAPTRRSRCRRTRTPPRNVRAARRPAPQARGAFLQTQGVRTYRCGQPRGVDVTLHLDQGDRSLGQAAVGMKDGIVQVLPALVRKAGLRRRARTR